MRLLYPKADEQRGKLPKHMIESTVTQFQCKACILSGRK